MGENHKPLSVIPNPLNHKPLNLSTIHYLYRMAQISLQQAMQELLKKSRFHQRVQALQIKDVWEEIMGKTIAQYTDDIQLVENKLIITTHTAPLKQELMFQREKIKNRINEKLNDYAVHEVHIK